MCGNAAIKPTAPACQPRALAAKATTKGRFGSVRFSMGTLKLASIVEYFRESNRSRFRSRSMLAGARANQSGYPVGCFLCHAQAVDTISSSLGYLGFQPNSRMAFSAEATNLGGSPGRLGFSTAGILLPLIFSHVWITWRTEYPSPFPRL